MASAMNRRRSASGFTGASQQSESDGSATSGSTQPTDYSHRPSLPHADTCAGRVEGWQEFGLHSYSSDDARASVETYASTVPSEHAFEQDAAPEFHVPSLPRERRSKQAIPATPKDFGDHFPSSRPLLIAHDDSTLDGNMNLRLDIPVQTRSGKHARMSLFHLRMHDLRNREFSLRRYCRDSGREVCHSVRKYQEPMVERRPSLHRSFTSALATFRPSKSNNTAGLHRHDSGYDSVYDPVSPQESLPSPTSSSQPSSVIPTNTIKLEFSNYTHINVKRRGAKEGKRYEFEYWGHSYAWRRVVRKVWDKRVTSYHLLRDDDDLSLAEISPVPLLPAQEHVESAKGGWIPPCSMRILDEGVLQSADLADVIVSTGLMALVDDSIKQKFHSKHTAEIVIPLTRSTTFKLSMDAFTPKRLIDEVFHRAPSQATTNSVR